MTFSENLRSLNLPLPVDAVLQKRLLSETCFVFAGQSVHSGKFKHLKYSEHVNFAGTNNVDSILEIYHRVEGVTINEGGPMWSVKTILSTILVMNLGIGWRYFVSHIEIVSALILWKLFQHV